MRYSQAAASLLSTVFTFQAKLVVVDADKKNIFNPTTDRDGNVDVDALALTADNKKKNKRANFLDFKDRKQKCKDDGNDEDCKRSAQQDAADIGILADSMTTPTSSSSTWIALAVPSTCTAGFVECKDGVLVSDGTTTCFDECAGGCCTYDDGSGGLFDTCEDFTGKVCKDGSCNGDGACYEATIPSVVNSCKGEEACYFTGYDGGSIKSMVDSCNGEAACANAAVDGGSIGNIIGSCNGELACNGAASDYGSVGDITESCIGRFACDDIGSDYGKVGNIVKSCLGTSACDDAAEKYGMVGNISASCIGEDSCNYLGKYGGTIGDVTNACTAYEACYYGAYAGGTIASITNSCTAEKSCYYLAKGSAKVGDVKDSCTAPYSCYKAGFARGSLGSITTSCKAEDACRGAGSGLTGVITSNLNGCCNAASACKSATQATLPAQCKNSKVRKSNVLALKPKQLSIPFY